MNLSDIVDKYRALSSGFGVPVALEAFGLSHDETVATFAALDEDYHISRFFHFSLDPALEKSHSVYRINGFPQSHVSLDAEISEIL